MADITGYVYYSPKSCAADLPEDLETTGSGYVTPVIIDRQYGIPNVPVIVMSIDNTSHEEIDFVCVLTDEDGKYTVTNVVLNQSYKVIEAFGYEAESVQSTVDFQSNKRSVQSLTTPIVPKDPSVEYILTHHLKTYGGNRIVSISPNTRLVQPRSGGTMADIQSSPFVYYNSLDFRDAPQRCDVLVITDFLQFQNAVIKGENLIQKADRGTFGSVDIATPASSSYLSVYSGENFSEFVLAKYSLTSPQNDAGTIVNIAAKSSFSKSWFDSADHTAGDETGRFMIINGDNAGKAFFKTTLNIESDTVYLFSCWAMNMLRFPDSGLPKFSIKIYDSDSASNQPIYYRIFDEDHPMYATDIPTWRQIGTIITPADILNKTNITIAFTSEGAETAGNDYAIDDITVVALKRGVVARKAIVPDLPSVELGGEINYVCTITNLNEDEAITHVLFKELFQEGVTVKENSVTITWGTGREDILIPPEQIPTFYNMVDNAGIDIGKILSDLVPESDDYYVPLKLEKIPPNLPIIIKFTIIVNTVNKIDPYSNVKNRFRLQFLSELDVQDTSRPRAVASNEVITPVVFPILEAEKSLSKIENGETSEVDQGGSVYGGTDILYAIKITNTGKGAAHNISIKDDFEDIFLFEFPDRPECAVHVTSQITDPAELAQENEQDVPCEDIVSWGTHGMEINNISVPPAASEEEPGICIVRIYGKIKPLQ